MLTTEHAVSCGHRACVSHGVSPDVSVLRVKSTYGVLQVHFAYPIGADGDPGPQGESGDAGPNGRRGPGGRAGPKGDQGETGGIGPRGGFGAKGVAGAIGGDGRPGPSGPIGPAGLKGLVGSIGPTGDRGKRIDAIIILKLVYFTVSYVKRNECFMVRFTFILC